MANKSRVIGRSKAIKSYLSRLLPMDTKPHFKCILPSLAGWFLAAFGFITLAWVGQLTWHDVTVWGKDLALIFFGSRTSENISLGIGMKVIYYFLIGSALLLLGLVTLLRRRSRHINLHLSRLLFKQKGKEEMKKKEDSPVKPPEKEEKGPSECPHNFGYLASRLKNTSIPQECLICPKILECIAVETYEV